MCDACHRSCPRKVAWHSPEQRAVRAELPEQRGVLLRLGHALFLQVCDPLQCQLRTCNYTKLAGRFPKFFKHSGYKGPKSDNDGPFQYAWETDVPFFPWLEANPPNLANFAQFMSAYRAGKPSWYDPGFYPVRCH